MSRFGKREKMAMASNRFGGETHPASTTSPTLTIHHTAHTPTLSSPVLGGHKGEKDGEVRVPTRWEGHELDLGKIMAGAKAESRESQAAIRIREEALLDRDPCLVLRVTTGTLLEMEHTMAFPPALGTLDGVQSWEGLESLVFPSNIVGGITPLQAGQCLARILQGNNNNNGGGALSCISFAGCTWLRDAHLQVAFGGGVGKALPALTAVDLSGCARITDRGLCALLRGVPGRLTSLKVGKARKITDVSLGAMMDTLPLDDVRVLDLSGLSRVSDAVLAPLLGAMSSLIELDVSGCARVGDAAMLGCIERNVQLTRLGMSNTQITDETIRAVASCLSSLTELSLGLSAVSDSGLKSLARSLYWLRVLDLSRCNNITDKGVESLDALPHLTWLSLSGARHVSDEGLMGVVQDLCSLSFLDVSYNVNITDTFVLDALLVSRSAADNASDPDSPDAPGAHHPSSILSVCLAGTRVSPGVFRLLIDAPSFHLLLR